MSATRFSRHIGHEKTLGPLPDVLTRQRKRAARRKAALKFINDRWGGEPRRIKRAMAFRLATKTDFVPGQR